MSGRAEALQPLTRAAQGQSLRSRMLPGLALGSYAPGSRAHRSQEPLEQGRVALLLGELFWP